jgi:glycosyltransferase involved in cell wall biosynthesis
VVASRIVFLTPVTPAAGGNGLAMRAGVFLEGLSRTHDVEVVVVPVFGPQPVLAPPLRAMAAGFRLLDVEAEPDAVADYTRRLATPAGRARAQALHPRPTLSRSMTLDLAEETADVAAGAGAVHTLRSYLAPLLDVVLDQPQRPALLLDVDDVESVTHRRLGQAEEASRFARLEAHYLPLVDLVITASPEDARHLGRQFALRGVTTVPNAVRVPAYPTETGPRSDLLFVGNLSYAPNVDGVHWLCRDVLPLLPDVTLAAIGRNPPDDVLALANERVHIGANVPDVGPWYAGSRVAVVPLWSGGGTRIKVLEAFAHRRPVVSTPVGAEGLGTGDGGLPVVVAETPEGFAGACQALLGDATQAAALAQNGHRAVCEEYTVEVVAARIDGLLRHTLSG